MVERIYIVSQALRKAVVMAGKSYREGISTIELAEMIPTEDSACEWFESKIWPDGRNCTHCKSTKTIECKGNRPKSLAEDLQALSAPSHHLSWTVSLPP